MFPATHARPFSTLVTRATALALRRPRDAATGPIRAIPLTGISNHATGPQPAPARVSRMPASASNTDQEREDAPSAPGPTEHALAVLSGQIHALLAQCRAEAPADFANALEVLDLDPREPLARKQSSALLRAIKRLPNGRHVPERQKALRAALYDLTRAARAEAMLHEQIARHTERERINALPGSQRSAGTGGMLGVRFGLPSGVHAGAAAGARQESSVATFDDLTVATIRSATVSAEASVQASVGPGVGVEGRLSGYSTEGDADISMSMRTRVLRLAHASVARRLGGNVLQRAFKRVTEPRRDRYDERTSRAMALQSTLPVLLGKQAVAQPLAFGKRGLLITAGMTTHGGALAASAGYGLGQLGATAAANRTVLRAALPTRLTELGEDGLPASKDAGIRTVLDARVAHLVGNQPRSHALQIVQEVMASPRDPDTIEERQKAVAHVSAAFDHLQALADLSLRAPAKARAPLASLARDWGGSTAAPEPVMIALLDTLAWLQAVPAPDTRAAAEHAGWARLQRSVQSEARRIHDTTLPHDRAWVYRATHAFREQIQRIATTRGSLSLSASLPLLTATGETGVARHVRQDPDPLRNGDYLELTVAARLAPALGTILSEVEQQLPEWGALPLHEAEALVAPLSADLGVSGTSQLLVRFFRPSFQTDPDFPPSARGNHLHAVRLATGTAQSLGVTVPVPVLPGLAPTIRVEHNRATQFTRYDRLGEGTLTSALMRYLSLCSATQPRAETWAALLDSHGADLDRLAEALTDPGSVPSLEARYWLQREPTTTIGGATTRRENADTSTLDAFTQAADAETRRAQLYALFEAVGAITTRQKAMSSLIGALTLPVVG
ncbi:hypothetical protein PWP89_06810 [Stenotrophomonas rhizophila]|uniref:hypothetical protein n=1 Tax=Stenotrophomonas rhizophila TaxID=216778 RepID=UPI000B89E178|nr:hypothetical protein [Stenotrophomonas rhizophila]